MRHPLYLGQEVVGQHRDVRLVQPRRGEDVHHALGRDRLRDDLPHGQVEVLLGAGFSRRPLRQRRPHGLEEPDVVPDPHRLVVRHGQRERLGQRQHGVQATLLCRPPGPGRAPGRPAGGSSGPAAYPSSTSSSRSRGTARSTPRTSPASPRPLRPGPAPSVPCLRSRCRWRGPSSGPGPAPGSRPPGRRVCP